MVDGSPYTREGRLIGWETKDVHAAGVDTVFITLTNGTTLRGVVRDASSSHVSVMPHDTREWEEVNRSDIAEMDVGHVELVWQLAAQRDFPVLRVQDVMVYNLIHWVKWERPVYFAVTVSGDNRIGLDPYLRMEGMVLKVGMDKDTTVEPGSDMYGLNPERSAFNLDSVYVMRYLMDQSIYKDDNMQKLISNYRSAYLQLADTYLMMNQPDDAAETMHRLLDRLPMDWRSSFSAASIIARQDEPALQALAQMYAQRAANILTRQIEQDDLFSPYLAQQARMTSQLLRFTSEDDPEALDDAINLLDVTTKRANKSPNATLVDQLALSFELAMVYEDAARPRDAHAVFTSVERTLATLSTRPGEMEKFRAALQMDPNRLLMEIQQKQSELEQQIRIMDALDVQRDSLQ